METLLKRICLVLALCCLFTVDGSSQATKKDHSKTAYPKTPPRPSDCESFEKIDVHLTLQNQLQPEYFEYNVTLHDVPKHQLIRHLELAAEKDKHFKFSATYFAGLGYFIDSINGLFGKWNPDKTYWEILNSHLEQTELGVGSYVPTHGELVTFNFTRSTK
ncbi:hypothetical protein LOTGIDRAFT_237142 [Lottia gigantea]|uniref:Uncharacterized protein n=1 Tax=Lottia gigantea TaxID=225164 RepID=V3ZDP4_LOTGI|nr:hypothetical protein LOTGIDRAFT_237142 [Lottia gigantea]ESO82162.1 hypothetical protein LOTGIDRAFT_237142 [Lottia gigantea]